MKTLFLIIALFFTFALQAQKNYNPYASIGKKGKMLTLSNGKYNELELYDSLQRVGSVIVNMNTGKIHKLLPIDTIKDITKNDPTVISRWYSLDPLQAKYPSLSPYNFVGNSPLMFVDPDGKIIKPVNPDGFKAFDAMIRSFIPQGKNEEKNIEKIQAVFGVRGTNQNGFYTANLDNKTLKPLGPDEFREIAKKNGVSKSNVEDAYTVYLALASNKTIEVEVYNAGKNATTTNPGEPPTVIVPSIPGFNPQTQNPTDIGNKRAEINTNGANEPTEFIPDNRPVNEQQPNAGVIIVNGTGKTEKQQAKSLFTVIKELVKPKSDEKK